MLLITLSLLLLIYYLYYIIIFYKGLDKKYLYANTTQEFISVVVAARNEEENIHRLLLSLINQTYPKDLYEIIIVNDRSTDSTEEIVKEFQKQFERLKIINVVNGDQIVSYKKNALSLGIKEAKGTIIATTDADCFVKENWLMSLMEYFTREVGLVAGFSQTDITSWRKSKFIEKYEHFDFIALFSAASGAIGRNKAFSCSGQNLAYRKEAYTQINGFEKIKNEISGDDVLLMQLIRHIGWKIRFAFSTRTYVFTRPQESIKAFINQRIRWASNSRKMWQFNKEFLFFLIDVFLLNLLIIISIFLSKWTLIILLVGKGIMDYIVVRKGFNRFKINNDRMSFFLMWFLLQPIYTIIVGILGILRKFSWKV